MATSFSWVFCHHKLVTIGVNKHFLHKWHHVSCIITSSIIPSLSILNIDKLWGGGWQPCHVFSKQRCVTVHVHVRLCKATTKTQSAFDFKPVLWKWLEMFSWTEYLELFDQMTIRQLKPFEWMAIFFKHTCRTLAVWMTDHIFILY